MNLIDVTKTFETPEACNDFLEAMRWPDGATCLYCESKRVSKYVKKAGTRQRLNMDTGEMETKPVPTRILYVCLECGKQFSVTEGTIFNDTHLSLDKWFAAVALMVNAKKGLSALQMKRDLKCAYKTAWFLNQRIRKAMGLADPSDDAPLAGTVEVDETYKGSKKYNKRRKSGKYLKEPVFGMEERGRCARTFHVPAVNRLHVIDKIKNNISIQANAVYTDESQLYNMPSNIQRHEIVNHSAKEWVSGGVHTDTIDGYWSLLQRGVIGSLHQISIKQLHRYLSEFQFRWNNREAQDMFLLVIAALMIGFALPYKELIRPLEGETDNGPGAELDGEPF